MSDSQLQSVQFAFGHVSEAKVACVDFPCGKHMKEAQCCKYDSCELAQAANLLHKWLDKRFPRRKLPSRPGDAIGLMLLAQKHGLEKR